MPETKPQPDDSEQSQRFIEMAREVDAEGDSVRFEKTLSELLLHAPTAQKNKGKGEKGGT